MDQRRFFILLVFLASFILPDAEFGDAAIITIAKQEIEHDGIQAVVRDEHGGLFPINDGRYNMPFKDDTGSRLAPYSQCSSCTCCSSGNTTCLQTSCCYRITCAVAGTCSFQPTSCGCSDC